MKISIDDLKTERQWRSATGLTESKFRVLLGLLEQTYLKKQGETMADKQARCPGESAIQSCEDLLLFTLLSLKAGLTYDLLGLMTGMDGSNAKRNQDFGVSLLKSALRESDFAPKREFESVEAFETYFAEMDSLILDGTEQRVERPQKQDSQKANYSGKKKLTPLKRSSFRAKTRGSIT